VTETRMLLLEVNIRTVHNTMGLQMWYFQTVTKTLNDKHQPMHFTFNNILV